MPYRLAALALIVLAPASVRAADVARETPERKGFYFEFAARPGGASVQGHFVPALRTHMTLGAGLTDRFKLGMSLTIGGYFEGFKKASLGLDTLATGYLWRGMYLRGGFGLVSRVPVDFATKEARPGYGGQVGFGYEWTIKGDSALGLGADFDVRMTSDKRVVRGVFVGLHFAFH
jgi:hypothetical protein